MNNVNIDDLKRRLTQQQYTKNADHTHKCSQLLALLTYINKFNNLQQQRIIESCKVALISP